MPASEHGKGGKRSPFHVIPVTHSKNIANRAQTSNLVPCPGLSLSALTRFFFRKQGEKPCPLRVGISCTELPPQPRSLLRTRSPQRSGFAADSITLVYSNPTTFLRNIPWRS